MAHKHCETTTQHPPSHLKRKVRDKLDHPGNCGLEDQHLISELKLKLRTAEQRVLSLQLRNRAVLEDLDDLRASSAADVEEAQKRILFLGARYAALKEESEHTQREKEDMNDVLAILVQKVEACNADFSAWKPTNLRMSRSLSIIPQDATPTTRSEPEPCSCPHAYGPALVAELSRLLSRERDAHAQTILAAEQRVAHYEAAIARREADLACVVSGCHCEAASVVAASINESGGNLPKRASSPESAGKGVERTLALEVHNLRGEVHAEKSRHAKRRKSTPVTPSKPPNQPPAIRPSPSTITPPTTTETDLEALTRQIDSLRAEVQRLTSEKDVLKRAVEAQYPTNLPRSSSPSPTRHERELALLQENDRLREALARAQRHPSPFRSHSLPSPGIHPSSIYPSTDLFRSPLPNPSAIDLSFPPLTPDQSLSATPTSFHGYSAHDDVESLFPVDVSEVVPLPLSPLLSPLPSLTAPSRSQSHSRPHSPSQTPQDMSLCSNDSDETADLESPNTAAQLRQQCEADLEAQLAIERFGADIREREILELRGAIATLALGAGLPDPIPPEFYDTGASEPG